MIKQKIIKMVSPKSSDKKGKKKVKKERPTPAFSKAKKEGSVAERFNAGGFERSRRAHFKLGKKQY